jgi:DNA primase
MKAEWVDFKKLKEAIDIQMVLDHYGIKNLITHGEELRGPCPIHPGSQRSKNFTVNVRKNAFKCFSKDCGASGNILDLVVAMEQCSVREAGIKLQEWFRVEESERATEEHRQSIDEAAEVSRGIYRDANGSLFEVVTTARKRAEGERVVLYRELFGDYNFWVDAIEKFAAPGNASSADGFTFVKAL